MNYNVPLSNFAFNYHLCRYAKVVAYGFSTWKKRTSHNQGMSKYHYFDKIEGVDNVHSFDLTLRALTELGKHYPLSLRNVDGRGFNSSTFQST